jgi:hypothetical protein
VVLTCTPEHAFALFTTGASEWWPEERRHTNDPRSEIRMLSTGRFWERARDGHEVELGHVQLWDPPYRLVLDFYPGTDAQHPTRVVVTFAVDPDGTRVTIEHGPTLASEDLWRLRAPRFDQSWDVVLRALERWSCNAF